MDFSLLLVLAVALSGAIYLLDVLVLRPKRRERVAKAETATMEGLDAPTREKLLKEPWPVDYARSLGQTWNPIGGSSGGRLQGCH
mgnify:CR=1 FL=1